MKFLLRSIIVLNFVFISNSNVSSLEELNNGNFEKTVFVAGAAWLGYRMGEELNNGNFEKTVCKSIFVAGAVWLGYRMGENFAIEILRQTPSDILQYDNWLIDRTVGPLIRNEALLAAIPVFSRYGATYGAMTMSVIAPIVFDDCSSVIFQSWNNLLTPLDQETNRSKKLQLKRARPFDLIVGLGSLGGAAWGSYLIYKYYNQDLLKKILINRKAF